MPISDKVLESSIAPFVVRDVPKVENTSSVDTVIASLKATPTGSVLVVDSGTQELSGIVTRTDLAKLRASQPPKNADDLATKEVIAIKNDAQLWQLLKIMNGENALQKSLSSLPVVDADGKPVGIVRREQLIWRLAEVERNILM